MSSLIRLVLFRLGEQRYGLSLDEVERVVCAAEITALPKAPALVLGIIDVEGCLLPVLNLRRRLGLIEREISPDQQFLIARTRCRRAVLIIDEVLGLVELPSSKAVNPEQIAPGLQHVQGVVQLPDGLVLIYDLERFFSLQEEHALDQALEVVAHG